MRGDIYIKMEDKNTAFPGLANEYCIGLTI